MSTQIIRYNIKPGQKYGMLTAVEKIPGKNPNNIWVWLCDCGNTHEIVGSSVAAGRRKSCGCLKNINNGKSHLIHGYSRKNSISAEYKAWQNMKKRCNNPNDISYHNYGGRGIKFCERWKSFIAFLEDVGPKPKPHNRFSLDRINVDGDYTPENTRWIDNIGQARNKRDNRILTLNGRSLTMIEWSEITKIPHWQISWRIRHGWSDEKALTTPLRITKRTPKLPIAA